MKKIISNNARGPVDHDVRDQIVEAANQHFSQYGYGKSTVSDLAKSIGFSKAYVYKFFESKQAIGEVICARCLDSIMASVNSKLKESTSPPMKFRILFNGLVDSGLELFFQDYKLYEIVTYAASEKWPPTIVYEGEIKNILEAILREGRESGDFERKTPLDETVESIYLTMKGFINPLLMQHNLDLVKEAPGLLSALILRSLAP
ncbi:TetR/AcrR family transcriptional regulator [Methylophilus sp. Leaf408]|uniref:TetR/AcrR family transcriptional regulator n=1 Tax=Methylophilus sp. Leaf408 TaxID=2876561 RepID=UPI001E3BA736|nr:TetR/AcrR family transcriptional regulator [Methylophilus sp. Leaf408]